MPSPQPVPRSVRILGWLARAYPPSLRRQFGTELISDTAWRWQRARDRGPVAATMWWLKEGSRFVVDGLVERLQRRTGTGRISREPERPPQRRWSGFRTDVYASLRDTARNWRFSGVLTIVLALAMGVASGVFTLLDGIVLKPLDYPEPDRLVAVWARHAADDLDRIPLTQWDVIELQKQTDVFEQVGSFTQQKSALHLDDGSMEVGFGWLTRSTLELLGVQPILGRPFTVEDQGELVVLLSHEFWQTHYGADPDIVGKTLRLAQQPWTIVGVLPPDTPLELPARGRVPLETSLWSIMWVENPDPDATSAWMRTVARLAPGVTVPQARAAADRIAERSRSLYSARETSGYTLDLDPMREDFTAGVSDQLWLVLLGSLVLILAAAFNGGNLLVLQQARRRHRTSVQLALGATRGRLARAALLEVFVICAVAGVMSLLVGWFTLQLLLTWVPADFPRLDEVEFGTRTLAFMASVGLPSACILGFFSVTWTVGSGMVVSGGRPQAARSPWGRTLVGVEVAMATALLAVGLLLGRSAMQLSTVDPGFDPDDAVALRLALPNAGITFRDLGDMATKLSAQVAQLPTVRSVGIANTIPLDGNQWTGPAAINNGLIEADQGSDIDYRFVSAGYLESIGAQLIDGELPRPGDPEEHVVIDDALAAALWPDGRRAIGQRLAARPLGVDTVEFVVSGVVENLKHEDLGRDGRPTAFFTSPAFTLPYVTLVVRSELSAPELFSALGPIGVGVHPDLLVAESRSVESLLNAATALSRWLVRLVIVFAATAAMITALGLYAVVGQFVMSRRPALGVMKALGAQPRRMAWFVAREVWAVGIAGLACGLVLSIGASHVVRDDLFGVSPGDPASNLLAALVVAALAVGAASVPTLQATRVDPMRALREDQP